jgi:hypothetical protein
MLDRGCIDLVSMRCMLWPQQPCDGRAFLSFDVGDDVQLPAVAAEAGAIVTREVVAQALCLRQALCYSTADAVAAAAAAADGDGDDGGVGDACINSDGRLSPALLLSALRRSCRARTCVPGEVSQSQSLPRLVTCLLQCYWAQHCATRACSRCWTPLSISCPHPLTAQYLINRHLPCPLPPKLWRLRSKQCLT